MWKLLSRWTAGRPVNVPDNAAGLSGELQSLRLELAERDVTIVSLKQDLARAGAGLDRQVAEKLDHRLESLFREAAAPVAQLLTQAFLVDQQGKDVPVRDVVRLARRIVRALEDAGLEIRDTVGNQVAFDASLHEPLSSEQVLVTGARVAIRFCGIAFRGCVLRKASVSPVEG